MFSLTLPLNLVLTYLIPNKNYLDQQVMFRPSNLEMSGVMQVK